MQPSSALCRKQEAFHRERAAATSLENIRTISEDAAKAWALEASLAERREERQDRLQRTELLLVRGTGENAPDGSDGALSENPDRGFANA